MFLISVKFNCLYGLVENVLFFWIFKFLKSKWSFEIFKQGKDFEKFSGFLINLKVNCYSLDEMLFVFFILVVN